MSELAYLSLGSNLGDREAAFRDAIARLAEVGRVRAVSAIYEAEPVDVADQPWFLNCAVILETDKNPEQLIESLLSIEEAMGRRRTKQKGPRNIDIDILLYGRHVVDMPGLKIPHPAMHRRRFVLESLAEIAPEAFHPGLKKTARELLDALPAGQAVRRIPATRGLSRARARAPHSSKTL